MAVIDCQLEFTSIYFTHVTAKVFGQLHLLGIALQVDIFSFGFIQLSSSYFNYVQTYRLVFVSSVGRSDDAVTGWASEITFPQGLNIQDYFSACSRFFGVNFRQDFSNIYINKLDLPLLSPAFNNTAESLLIALLLRIMLYESNDMVSLINIYYWRSLFVSLNQRFLILNTLIVEVNVPAIYKYVDVEITNASNELSPKELDL